MRKAPAGSPRPLLEDVAHSPARAPQGIWQPPRGSREREVTAPWHPSHHIHWSKREESAGDQTPAPRPPSGSHPERAAVPAHSAAPGPGSSARSCLQLSGGARAEGRGGMTGKKAEQGRREGASSRGREGTASRRRKRPGMSPREVPPFPNSPTLPPPVCPPPTPAHPGPPRAHELILDVLRLSEGPRPGLGCRQLAQQANP